MGSARVISSEANSLHIFFYFEKFPIERHWIDIEAFLTIVVLKAF